MNTAQVSSIFHGDLLSVATSTFPSEPIHPVRLSSFHLRHTLYNSFIGHRPSAITPSVSLYSPFSTSTRYPFSKTTSLQPLSLWQRQRAQGIRISIMPS